MAYVFPKLRTPKNLVRSMAKKSSFRGSVEKQYGKCAQTLLEFQEKLLYLLLLITGKSIVLQKISVSDMQNLKTLSANGKYSLLERDNLTQRI